MPELATSSLEVESLVHAKTLFSERSQFLRIGNCTSTQQQINGGIPVRANDSISTWGPRIKFVHNVTAMKMVHHIVSDIQTFAWYNNMKLNPKECKEMIVKFFHYNATEWQPVCIDVKQIEIVTVFQLLWFIYLVI